MVVVFGTICLDRIRRIARWPGRGEYLSVLDEELVLGGEAANTAFALGGWGCSYRLFGNALDADLAARLDRHGLAHERPRNTQVPVCDIYVTPDGERTMFGIGFDQMAESVDLDVMPTEADAWFTGDMNFHGVGVAAARRAKTAGMRLYLMDLEPAAVSGVLGPGDWWQSSTDWFGRKGDTDFNLDWAAGYAREWGANVVLTDASEPMVLGRPGFDPVALLPFTPPAAHPGGPDATGAGDRFRAGMLRGLHEGHPVGECLAFAAAAAAMKIAYPGAVAPVATAEEIGRFRARQPDVEAGFARL